MKGAVGKEVSIKQICNFSKNVQLYKMVNLNKNPILFNTLQYFKGNNLIAFFIVIIAAILRFYKFSEIPYTLDELSALLRTNYDSYTDLINLGILRDGHPAGIQSFLFYWVKIFGYSEAAVKLPFIICGIASVWLVYIIGKKWFNSTVGLLSAAFIATIQFTVMYSQIERPYASGLFFFLLFVYFWSNIIIEKRNQLYNWIGFSISAALCAYNHYFTLFSALIAAFFGLLLISRQHLKKYLLFCFFAIMLTLPHINIFIIQLSHGGLNWLPKPKNSFFITYLDFIFSFSCWLEIFFIILLITGVFLFLKNHSKNSKNNLRFTGLIWFLLPIITCFVYSMLGKPVLQYSALIFSVPFLFLATFSFFPLLKLRTNAVLVFLIFCFTIPSLVFGRQYYKFFYNQGYDAIAKNQIALLDSVKQPVSLLINGYEPFYLKYYTLKYHHKIPCNLYVFDMLNNIGFRNYILNLKTDYIAIAHVGVMPLQNYDIAQTEFPYFVKRSVGFGYEWYVFSKIPQKNSSRFYLESNNYFDKPLNDWSFSHANICKSPTDSTNDCYKFNEGEEWGPGLKGLLQKYNCCSHDFINISAKFYSENCKKDAVIVLTLTDKNDSLISWIGASSKDFYNAKNKWQTVNLAVRLTEIKLSTDSVYFNTYIWNVGKTPILLDDFCVRFEKGNPFIYAIISDF